MLIVRTAFLLDTTMLTMYECFNIAIHDISWPLVSSLCYYGFCCRLFAAANG